MADNHKDDLLILQYLANKALQKTQTALGSFSILLSHNGLLPVHGSLPVARARFGLLSAGVRTDVTANLSHSGIFMNQNTSQAAQAIIGAWRLISFEIERDDGTVIRPFGADAQGSIIYTDSGRFSVQVMRRGRPSFAAGDQMRGTPEEIEASYKGCISYYGSYKLDADGGFVVHQVEGSLFPNWEGEGQKLFFEFSGDRLKLSTPPTLWGGGGQVVGVLVWERISEPLAFPNPA